MQSIHIELKFSKKRKFMKEGMQLFLRTKRMIFVIGAIRSVSCSYGMLAWVETKPRGINIYYIIY
jgi:hypothetical protein